MKKIYIFITALASIFAFSACSDILESDSSRQRFDPELDSKTDSVFYAFGILQAMQQLADQYVFLGEMRGDNVDITENTDSTLRQIANFSATTTNKYDSAYVYYKVINNCNYYIAHRDTTLLTGSTNVVINEYAAVKAIRAWAYLMLARNYERVPFFTEPLTKISQIDNNSFPEYDLTQIVSALAPDLERYTGYAVPNFGGGAISLGTTNRNQSKTAVAKYCFIPVDVILGEMYLETGDYASAVKHYMLYLTNQAQLPTALVASLNMRMARMEEMPSDFYQSVAIGVQSWSGIFSNNSTTDLVTYIPMAVNRLQGTTTDVPSAFGYDYYATSSSGRYVDAQIKPSDDYTNITDTLTYYYYSTPVTGQAMIPISGAQLGDTRARASITEEVTTDSTYLHINKYNNGNIYLYRESTLWLHLAEAFNRLGYPDLAFAILKEGLISELLETRDYISEESKTYLSRLNASYTGLNEILENNTLFGIHSHGAGATMDDAYPGRSPYQYRTIVGQKLEKLQEQFADWSVGTSKQDSINAVEDLLCDEAQLEFAFEGSRFYDLCRMARHKNESGLYGSNYGSIWMARKLQYKNPQKDLTNPSNWYLPFK